MISDILPSGIAAVESMDDCADAYLLAEEAATLGNVIDKRRRDFTIGRTCARRALAMLGLPPDPILPGPLRQPIWPEGVVGSITHCVDYCAAAVALSNRILTIGIDAEPHERLPSGVIDLVSVEEERRWLAEQRNSGINWDRILFSAKESVFKAWFPIAGKWLGFEDATISLKPESSTFHARLSFEDLNECCRSPASLEGRYLVENSLVLTSVVVKNHH